MTRRLRIRPEAEDELAAAAVWYESKRAGLGAEFVALIDESLERIRYEPEASPIWRADRPYRRHVTRRFPFLVFYAVSDDAIEVIAFAHAKRRPGYWMGR